LPVFQYLHSTEPVYEGEKTLVPGTFLTGRFHGICKTHNTINVDIKNAWCNNRKHTKLVPNNGIFIFHRLYILKYFGWALFNINPTLDFERCAAPPNS
jgi:hypothetical protein